MKTRFLPVISVCLALLMCLTACSSDKGITPTDEENTTVVTEETTELAGHNALGGFVSQTLDGERVDQSIFDGKITMVNIWATYCGPCINEMPFFEQLNSEFKDKNFQIVGIVSDVYVYPDGSYEETLKNEAESVVNLTGVSYVNILPCKALNESKLNQVRYVPETIFLDEKGNQIGESYVGGRSYEDWKSIIGQVLEAAE